MNTFKRKCMHDPPAARIANHAYMRPIRETDNSGDTSSMDTCQGNSAAA